MGWLTVGAYFLAGALCYREGRREWKAGGWNARVLFWGVLTILLGFLGINKQLDLQTLLTLSMRRVAIAQGWYEERRIVQGAFVGMIGLAGVASAMWMRRLVGRYRDLWLPLAGFVLLVVFVIVRAASFHHIDQLINFRLAGVRMNWVLELGALGLVAVGAIRTGGKKSKERTGRNPWAATQ
jgi:hypothetical protein